MPFGSGKTMYLGSGEFWRLRSFKEGYHERFWIKLARYTSAGARERKKYGQWLLARDVPVGPIFCEAQVKGANFQWLPPDMRPTVIVKRIDKERDDKAPLQQFDMKAEPADGEWKGYFTGSIQIKEPGEYEFQLPIPGRANRSGRACWCGNRTRSSITCAPTSRTSIRWRARPRS